MAVKLNDETKRHLEATCPDCRGPLSEISFERLREYECLVGHRYSSRTLLQAHSGTEENVLWAAVVALEEAANLVGIVGDDFPPAVAARLREQAEKKMAQAAVIRRILQELETFATETPGSEGA
jgi:two-component system chemotaxis response regulator CheB